MKKLKRVCAIILFFTIFNFNHIYANEYNYDKITNVNIHIDGQVYIDTQINGVSVDYKKSSIEISNISIEIEENGKKKHILILKKAIIQILQEKCILLIQSHFHHKQK